MQKFTLSWIVSILLIHANCFALTPGGFFGVQAGEANTHLKASTSGLAHADIRNFAFNGRAFMGSQITSILGMELGYMPMRKIRVKNINQTSMDGGVKQHSIELLGRLNWHFAQDLDLIAKFGASYLMANPDATIRSFSNNDFQKKKVAHYRPALGIGLQYKPNFPLGLDISWQHLLRHRALDQLDFVAVGVTFYTAG